MIDRESGDVNYYRRVTGPVPHIHAEYRPPWETTVLGYEIPKRQRHSVAAIRWRWRALKSPKRANECVAGKGDSAAAVYVTWKRGLRWYSIKYVWSSGVPKGRICRKKRGLFRAQDTVVVESSGPTRQWRSHHIVPDAEFRAHFEGGDPNADVPALIGIGILTDGDQTRSASAADYAGFVVVPK